MHLAFGERSADSNLPGVDFDVAIGRAHDRHGHRALALIEHALQVGGPPLPSQMSTMAAEGASRRTASASWTVMFGRRIMSMNDAPDDRLRSTELGDASLVRACGCVLQRFVEARMSDVIPTIDVQSQSPDGKRRSQLVDSQRVESHLRLSL